MSSIPQRKRPLRLPDTRKAILSGLLTFIVCLFFIRFVDRPATYAAYALPPDIVKVFSHITRLGKSTAYLVTFGILFLLLSLVSRLKRWEKYHSYIKRYAWVSLFLFVSIAVSGILTDILKATFARYRPVMFIEAGKYGFTFFKLSPARMLSFPSGHTDTAFSLATALAIVTGRFRLFYFAIAALVAVSRVVVGAHFPSDVVAGAWMGVVTTLYLRGVFLSWGIDIFSKRGAAKPVRKNLSWNDKTASLKSFSK